MRAVLLDAGGVLLLPPHEADHEALRASAWSPETSFVDSTQYRAMRAADEAACLDEAADRSWVGYASALGVADGRVLAAVAAFRAVFVPLRT
jgi:hypothetical protein